MVDGSVGLRVLHELAAVVPTSSIAIEWCNVCSVLGTYMKQSSAAASRTFWIGCHCGSGRFGSELFLCAVLRKMRSFE